MQRGTDLKGVMFCGYGLIDYTINVAEVQTFVLFFYYIKRGFYYIL